MILKSHIICLQETWIEENDDTGYELFVDKVDASLDDAKASIYLNTIGGLLLNIN